jgi:hypothetical protein
VGHGQCWPVLLDGLDELEGEQAQRDVIRLISTFTQEHPDAPLAWIISSRPEPHISDTFAESKIRDSHESENIPIDSTEASKDVEHFLRASFDKIRDEFPRTVPRDWPGEIAIAKLATAASGLFIFAETAIRFIKDPDHANPVSRLELVLSVIARSGGVSTEEQPFALLDNLYKEILSHIPSSLWQTTKLLMRLALSFRLNQSFLGLSYSSNSRTLRGMAMILQLNRYMIYASLNKCYSILGIPPWEEAHVKTLMFLHASFADFLMAPERSGDFAITVDGIEEEILHFYLNHWHARFGVNSSAFSCTVIVLRNYLCQLTASDEGLVNEQDNETAPEKIDNFNLWEDTIRVILTHIVKKYAPQTTVSPALQQQCSKCLDSFPNINMITLCYSKYLNDLLLSLFIGDVLNAWEVLSLIKSNMLSSHCCDRKLHTSLLKVGFSIRCLLKRSTGTTLI